MQSAFPSALENNGQEASHVIRHVDEGILYEIRVEGHLDAFWLDWFQILTLTQASDGTTTLVSSIRDQAALYGLLDKLRDLGLPLVYIHRLEGDAEIPR
jgi:hypothetical protein